MNAGDIAACAVNALLIEVDTWPKPGLVSRVDSGSHADMDAALLECSARTLGPYFERLAEAGKASAEMAQLRAIGIEAEAAMLRATDGVNTHRGAIFGLGLLCAAAAVSAGGVDLGEIVRRRWGAQIGLPAANDSSHGARVWRRHGILGARAEAVRGFPHLYGIGWPALRAGRRLARNDEVAARVHCLMALMAQLDDTNLLHRGGAQGLLFARALASGFMQRGGVGRSDWREHAQRAHQLMLARCLSPGGSADLLAMTLFVDAVHASSERDERRDTEWARA
jgi:triphosphoribosyl-dephospho-CoA synthase